MLHESNYWVHMQVIHNPGTPPDAEMAEPGPDVIITCEESYERFKGDEVQKRLKDLHYDKKRSGYMISGIPAEEIGQAIKELATRATYIFATDLVEDFYESFGISWTAFISAVEEAAGAAPASSDATEIVHNDWSIFSKSYIDLPYFHCAVLTGDDSQPVTH